MIYAVSDLHGYPADKFKELLDRTGFCDSDFLFVLGDVIDRGSDGVGLLMWLINAPNAQLILGNHEAAMLSCSFIFDEITDDFLDSIDGEKLERLSVWLANGAEPTINALKDLLRRSPEAVCDILDYLSDAPLYETASTDSGDFLLVHSGLGGFRHDKKIYEYAPEELLWHRPDISERYYDGIITVFGHTPTFHYGVEHRGKILRTDTWINIDVGAGYGEAPCLLRLDDMREFR